MERHRHHRRNPESPPPLFPSSTPNEDMVAEPTAEESKHVNTRKKAKMQGQSGNNYLPPPFFFKKNKKKKKPFRDDGEPLDGFPEQVGGSNSSEEMNRDNLPPMVDVPKDLYQAHLRPGVVFRVHMAEAILKMQYRNYADDKDESVVEADVEYLRLTRKVISDEITKFEDLKWLVQWFANKTALIKEHSCFKKYYVVGIPPTMFTHQEEYMQRMCIFDQVYLDHIPYLIGDDNSLIAAVAPPILFCDAGTCTSVPFIDSAMFDAHLPVSEVRKIGRCEASCRDHCKNDVDCLKRCVDKCRRIQTDTPSRGIITYKPTK